MSYPYACIGPDDEPRLRDEHAFLACQLKEIIRLAASDSWKAWESAWELFVRELEQHMRYEESLIFPEFARLGRPSHLWAEELCVDHEEIRSQCRVLSDESSPCALRLERLQRLATTIQEHQEREGGLVLPWLASLPLPRFSSEALRPLLSAQPRKRVPVRLVEESQPADAWAWTLSPSA